MNKKFHLISFVILLILVVLGPQLWNQIRFKNKIYESFDIPTRRYGIVFGAQVTESKELADVTRERIDAGIMLYEQGKVEKLFISGDNRHNEEAEVIADYAENAGIKSEDIIVDLLGIDTEDTCRHFAQIA